MPASRAARAMGRKCETKNQSSVTRYRIFVIVDNCAKAVGSRDVATSFVMPGLMAPRCRVVHSAACATIMAARGHGLRCLSNRGPAARSLAHPAPSVASTIGRFGFVRAAVRSLNRGRFAPVARIERQGIPLGNSVRLRIQMGRLLNIVTPLHKMTKRDYLARMNDDKVHCMIKAKEYEFDYWDGDRRYGYGGYKFIDGRWKPVAQALIDTYGLQNRSQVLHVGCGKAFLLYEMKKLLPDLQVAGFDISHHGLADAREEIKPYLFRYRAQDRYPYGDQHFDLVISLGTLHNLKLFELQTAVTEIERVGRDKYIMVYGYRNEIEQSNLECWALTAESILHTSEWIWLYEHFGYTGDYEFIYFE